MGLIHGSHDHSDEKSQPYPQISHLDEQMVFSLRKKERNDALVSGYAVFIPRFSFCGVGDRYSHFDPPLLLQAVQTHLFHQRSIPQGNKRRNRLPFQVAKSVGPARSDFSHSCACRCLCSTLSTQRRNSRSRSESGRYLY